MNRTHISKSAAPTLVETRGQSPEPAVKPKGFWYEVNADWRRWCRDDGMTHWIEGRYLHRVTLGDERMLEIRSVPELDDFVEEYHVWERGLQSKMFPGETFDMDRGIRWADVASTYDGIEIAPYLWERRLDGPIWYYGWDCASGVIWRPRGVTVEKMRKLPSPAQEIANVS